MPLFKSQSVIYGLPLEVALLDAFMARPAAALLTTPYIHLFTAAPSIINGSTLPSAFTEATFTGYAPVSITALLGPITLDSNDGIAMHQVADFIAGAVSGGGQTILGYWIDNANTAGTILYTAETFPTPIPIVAEYDYITVDYYLPILNPMSAN